MADAAVSLALETLGSLLVDEGKFIFSVKGEVEEVQKELNSMHAFLKDADKRHDRYNSETVRNWVAELKELAYMAEDVLEKYNIKIASKREGNGLKNKVKRYSCILSEFVNVHHIGIEIVAVRSRMADLTQRLEAIIKTQSISSSSSDDNNQQQWLIRQTYAHQAEQHFVGMEEDIDRLVSLAMDGGSYPVISICGMGGLGKTTLARKLYQHEHVKSWFETRAWVCLTQRFQFKTALQQILKQLIPSERKAEVMGMDERELVVELHQVQMQKKCLVVIDDIWQIEHWNILSAAFPIADARCKILLTTRNEKIVAEECVYKLKFLTEDQGWELLQKIGLPENFVQVVPAEFQELEKIGREVIHKCGCLPLAISVMGGVLREKRSLGEWKKVNENFDTFVQYGEGIEKERRVAQVLDLSYEVLPYYLKPCFLYLGCYGEDEEIDVEKLLLAWMAEGMVHNETQGREETLTDVAERYLSELASRCLVQVKLDEFPSIYQRFKSCRLHDMMRELCLSKAKEEGFLESMDIYPESCHSLIAKTRRLAIRYQGRVWHDDVELEIIENLRCLLLNSQLYGHFGNSYHHLVSNLDIFSSLKILIIVSCDLTEQLLPSKIGNKLIHLKYLGFRDCDLDELPSSLSNLQRLQTLEVKPKGSYKVPINIIYKMKKLRHLFLECRTPYDDIGKDQRVRLDGLNELETFDGFHSEYFNAKDLIQLKSLRRFKASIYRIQSLWLFVNYISNQYNLRETILKVIDCDLRSEEGSIILRKLLVSTSLCRFKLDGQINRLPRFEPHQLLCPSLVDLTLSSSRMEDDPMEVLEKLLMLKRLRLKEAFVGNKMLCGPSGFPQLTYLLLKSFPNLKEWMVEKGAAPKLSTLRIVGCTKLEMIPDGLKFMITLQELQIVEMPQEFMDRLQNVDAQQGQDYDKVQHVSSIVYADFDSSKPDFSFSFLKGTELELLAYK